MLVDNHTNLADSEFEDIVTELSKMKRDIRNFEIGVLPHDPPTIEASNWHETVTVKSIDSGVSKAYGRGTMGAKFIRDLRAGYFG